MTTRQHPKARETEQERRVREYEARRNQIAHRLTRGTIAVISGEIARYSLFGVSLIHMLGYSGQYISHFDWLIGSNITGNCNDACRRMEGDWIWLIGDDHAFPATIVEQLLMREVDVVAPLCVQRSAPFPHVVYSGEVEDPAEEGTHILHTDLPRTGLHEVYAVGGAGLLVKRRVLDAIAENSTRTCKACRGDGKNHRDIEGHWHDEPVKDDPCGVCDGFGREKVWFETFGKQNEDLEFCRKIREAGFKIHVDCDAPLGHIGNLIAWPQWLDEEYGWGARLSLGNDVEVPLRRVIGSAGAVTPA